jgi:predicted MPP superfamily phosphohydrolase
VIPDQHLKIFKAAFEKYMNISRRKFLLGLSRMSILGVGGLAYSRYVEPPWFKIDHEKLNPGILKNKGRLIILHLSDFHASESVPYSHIDEAVSLGLKQKPDIICLTGDYITWELENPLRYREILSKLSLYAPTFACIGNHDGGQWAGWSHGYKDFTIVKNLLIDSGITFLFNSSVIKEIKGHTIEIAGLGDLWSGDLKPEKVLKSKSIREHAVIVLSHNPDCKTDLKAYDWDLMLCGHTHGGQFKVPLLNLAPFAPVRDKDFVDGLYIWNNRYIYITRGVGNLHGMRCNCRPQVSIVTI